MSTTWKLRKDVFLQEVWNESTGYRCHDYLVDKVKHGGTDQRVRQVTLKYSYGGQACLVQELVYGKKVEGCLVETIVKWATGRPLEWCPSVLQLGCKT